jgi:hypothetical protein
MHLFVLAMSFNSARFFVDDFPSVCVQLDDRALSNVLICIDLPVQAS